MASALRPAPPPTPATSGGDDSGPDGPVPKLLRALQSDNRSLVIKILRLGPGHRRRDATADAGDGDGGGLSGGVEARPVDFRQRIVFSDPSLRTLVLSHVLGDETARTVSAAPKPKKKPGQRERTDQGDEADDGHPLPKGLGVTGTRVLFSEAMEKDDGGGGGGGIAHGTKADGSGGMEVLLDSAFGAVSADDERDRIDGADVVTFFLRPEPKFVRAACALVRKYQSLALSSLTKAGAPGPKSLRHRLAFLPHCSALCERILIDEGVLQMECVDVCPCPVDLVPLDSDLLSMELSDIIRVADVEGVPSEPVSAVARSLVRIQDAAGVVRRVQSLGPLGEKVVERMMAMRVEENWAGKDGGENIDEADVGTGVGGASDADSEIDAMFVLDRKVDMVTLMMTPLTYEGLLDEVFGINCGFTMVDANVIEPPEEDGSGDGKKSNDTPPPEASARRPRTVALPLNDLDSLYAEVRNQHVEVFGTFLQGQAKALKESHATFTDRKRDLTEIHQFVKQIPVFTRNLRSLTNHIHLAELVKRAAEESSFRERWQTERSMAEGETCYEALEDLIATREPPYHLLRLMCLQSLTGGGIKSSRYDTLRRDVVQTYGYEYAFVLEDLERAGLLRRRSDTLFSMDAAASSPFSLLRRNLDLIHAEVDASDPDDVSYVSSGYAPLSVRLVQSAARGWKGRGDGEALRELPGRLLDVTQREDREAPEELAKARERPPGPGLVPLARKTATGKKPVLLVYFVGGVTFMEIASLRFLSRRPSFPYSIVIGTTKIVNGGTFLQSLS